MIDWATLIAERNEWVARNFPPQPDETPGVATMLGIVEELGELAHHDLKEWQGIRGTPAEHQAAAKDAIGDYTVYLLGVMARREDFDPASAERRAAWLVERDQHKLLLIMAGAVGDLATGVYASTSTDIPAYTWEHRIGRAIKAARTYCDLRGWDYEEIVQRTWDHVKQRDWVKNKRDGGNEGVAPSLATPQDPLSGGDDLG